MIPPEWIEAAARRMAGRIQPSPLTCDPDLRLYIKWENRQETGSFKIRGALNKVLSLQPWELERGLVTASAGNHGQGVAAAGRIAGARVTVFVSDQAVPMKLEAMRALGAELRLTPGGYGGAERAGLQYAHETGATWVSPYNDGQVIAGQATVAVELLEQLAPQAPGVVIVPAGGGGLLAGIGVALDRLNPRPRLIGVQSEASPFLHALYHHGSQNGVEERESLADGLAGPVEAGAITINMARRYVDDLVLVTEENIARAMAFAWQRYGEKIEGSAATALSVVLAAETHPLVARAQAAGQPVVAVITGGNVQAEVHAQICARYPFAADEGEGRGDWNEGLAG